VRIYEDSCPEECDTDGGMQGGNNGRISQSRAAQQYILLPNPNDGNIILQQQKSDEGPVDVKVYNVIGALVHDASIIFESNVASLNLSTLTPGMYYVVLQDSDGAAYKLSFIKK
jgi:hypothetical protein